MKTTKKGVFICAACNKEYKYKNHVFTKHVLNCDGVPIKEVNFTYSCNNCPKKYNFHKSFIKHVRSCTSNKDFWCQRLLRPSMLKPEGESDIHPRPNKGYKCQECGTSFKGLCQLRLHETCHVGATIPCHRCGAKFIALKSLHKHLKSHSIKPHTCDTCGEGFYQKAHLAKHIKMKHTKRIRPTCDKCGQQFRLNSTLRRHEIATGHREFQCPRCGKDFKTLESMERHVEKHDMIPIKKKFITIKYPDDFKLEYFQENLDQVENKPPTVVKKPHLVQSECTHECTVCGRKFATPGALRFHSILHNEERPFRCEECGRGFKRNNNLRDHLKTHTPETHICSFCGKVFSVRKYLQRHLKLHNYKKPTMEGYVYGIPGESDTQEPVFVDCAQVKFGPDEIFDPLGFGAADVKENAESERVENDEHCPIIHLFVEEQKLNLGRGSNDFIIPEITLDDPEEIEVIQL